MPLDIHVMNVEAEAPTSRPVLQFEEDVHEAIFFARCFEPQQYPLLNRMRDYYADIKYAGRELTGLIEELKTLRPKLPADARIQDCLARFDEICQAAFASDQRLLCFAD